MKFIITRIAVMFLSLIIKPKQGVFIFGSWLGNKYGDNPRAVYEYLSTINKVDVYWYTNKSDISNKLSAAGMNSICGFTLKNALLHLRAEAVFCNCSPESDLLGMFLNKKTKIFNLWHGTPIKKIGKDAIASGLSNSKLGIPKKNAALSIALKLLPSSIRESLKKEVYFLASSETVSKLLQSAMELDEKRIIKCGYPKLDRCKKAKIEKKGILYAPTYRGEYDSEIDLLTMFGFDVKYIESVLEKQNESLHIRLHPANKLPEGLIEEIQTTKNIKIDISEDVYDSLESYSLVITDFSSIYFDALAIGANVLIAPFGLEEYIENDRTLYFPLSELYPYHMPVNWHDLFTNYEKYVLVNKPQLSFVRDRFYDYSNKECSAELMQLVYIKLGRGFCHEY